MDFENDMPTVITVAGKARHGKDCSSWFMKNELERYGKRVLVTHYGDFLKFLVKEYCGWDGQKDKKGRSLLQYYGTEVVRKNYPMAWVDMMRATIRGFKNQYDYVIIADCRFFDDINWFDREGIKNFKVRINRTGFKSDLTEEQMKHRSETELDEYKFDYYIDNSGTYEELEGKVKNLIDEIVNK